MENGKVAVPYYGRLYKPRIGYERIFFIVEGESNGNQNVSLGVWDNQLEQSLPQWLKKNGIDSLVCKDKPESPIKNAINQYGINVLDEANIYANKLMKTLMV